MFPRNGASAQLHFCTWQSRSVCRPSSGRASSERSFLESHVRGGGQRRAKTVESGIWKPPYVLSSPNETTIWWVIAVTVKLERRVHAVPRIPIVPRSAAARRAVGGIGIMRDQGLLHPPCWQCHRSSRLVQLICHGKL